ncbi:MAG TPA: CsbD family protein [Steroidobacteraceae bacterium]|nr:CsbD family protein [Steroidobacteraceae bacterium]
MDQDRIKGAAKEKIGEAKKNLGKMTGDEKMKREGQVEEIGGKVQNTIGGVKDSLREQKHEDKHENH